MRKVLSHIRRAAEEYDMIKNGDKIAVGVSGGKDSLVLLAGLNTLRKFYPLRYEIVAITIDMGFPDMNFEEVMRYCKENDIKFILKKTEIGKVVFDIREESNPCSLCARMRRGVLHDAAKENGCNKVALGHNFDDAVETFFLNMFFEGRLGCFSPVTYLDRKDITIIRPLIYMTENETRTTAERLKLPVVLSTCPANGNTKREYMKNLIKQLEKENKGLQERIFAAIGRAGIDGWKSS